MDEGQQHVDPPKSYSRTRDGATDGTLASWSERMTELARLASTSTDGVYERDDVARSVHYHLDAIEGLLCDPRPEITQELERCRPNSGRLRCRSHSAERLGLAEPRRNKKLESSKEEISPDAATGDHREGSFDDGIQREDILSQLRTLMEEVTVARSQLAERRKESSEICDMYEDRCRGLERAVAELELEVAELKSDLAEDAVESEGIQGTIHGLQAWVDSLHAQQEVNRRERSIAQQSRRRWINRGKKIESRPELEAEMLLEGLSAWMRGWKDVEEEFEIRARARRTRREQRQALMTGEEIPSQRLSRRDILSKPLDETDAGLWSRAFPARGLKN